jgi:hypothetical protein
VLRVVVAAVNPSPVAHLALAAEGVAHDVADCRGELGYGEVLADLWRLGAGFIVVEHDVAPWPGAVVALSDCLGDWCAFRYPKGGRLIRALGCVKFSTRLVQTWPDLPALWHGVDWQGLEGAVLAGVAAVLRSESPHERPVCDHWPPVAHASGAN